MWAPVWARLSPRFIARSGWLHLYTFSGLEVIHYFCPHGSPYLVLVGGSLYPHGSLYLWTSSTLLYLMVGGFELVIRSRCLVFGLWVFSSKGWPLCETVCGRGAGVVFCVCFHWSFLLLFPGPTHGWPVVWALPLREELHGCLQEKAYIDV